MNEITVPTTALQNVLNHFLEDERADHENEPGENHIYHDLVQLQDALNAAKA